MSGFWEEGTISDDLSEGCVYCSDPQTYPSFAVWTLDLNFQRDVDHIGESHRRIRIIELEVNEIILVLSPEYICRISLFGCFYILILSFTIISFEFFVELNTLVKYLLKEVKKHQIEIRHFSTSVCSYHYFSL